MVVSTGSVELWLNNAWRKVEEWWRETTALGSEMRVDLSESDIAEIVSSDRVHQCWFYKIRLSINEDMEESSFGGWWKEMTTLRDEKWIETEWNGYRWNRIERENLMEALWRESDEKWERYERNKRTETDETQKRDTETMRNWKLREQVEWIAQ